MQNPQNPANGPVILVFTPQQADINTGQPVEFTANIRNAGDAVDQYGIEVDGIPQEWYSIDVQSLTLFPGDSIDVKVKVLVPENAGAISGAYPFGIAARSRTNPAWIGGQNGTIRLTATKGRKKAAGAAKPSRWPLFALLGLILLLAVGSFVAYSQGWIFKSNNIALSTPTVTPTAKPAAQSTPTDSGDLFPTSTPQAASTTVAEPTATIVVSIKATCDTWSNEHRGSRDTRIPPAVSDLGPYTIAGKQYTSRADFASWIYVNATGVISDIRIADLDLFKGNHTQPQALVGTLYSPDNVQVKLFTWACDPGALVSMHVTLDDKANSTIPYSCAQNFNGTYKPDGDQLSILKGAQAHGNWVLQVTMYTNEPFPTSYFNRWGLDLCLLP
ncbi:MAG: NEW3 domain-containing protein [Chloroflexia bacterium]